MDPATLLKAGAGRNGSDLLVAASAHGEVVLPSGLVLGKKKRIRVSLFQVFLFQVLLSVEGCGCSVKPVLTGCWKEARRFVDEDFFKEKQRFQFGFSLPATFQGESGERENLGLS